MHKATVGALLIMLGFSGKAFGNQASTETVVWPDYSAWTVVQAAPLQMYAETENQNYSNHLTGLRVEIGTVKLYVDNPENPLLGVAEVSVLGNDAVLRSLSVITPAGTLGKDLQLLVNGKWVSGKPSSLTVYLDNPKKWLCAKEELAEVVLTIDSLDGGSPVKLTVKEKR